MNEKELEQFKKFLEDYPGSTWWDFVSFVQYEKDSWKNFINGIFGV